MFLDDHPIFQRADGEQLTLHVKNMMLDMLGGFNTFDKEVHELSENADDETKKRVTLHYASVIFGEEQANMLFDFFGGSMNRVLDACNKYMEGLLKFFENSLMLHHFFVYNLHLEEYCLLRPLPVVLPAATILELTLIGTNLLLAN